MSGRWEYIKVNGHGFFAADVSPYGIGVAFFGPWMVGILQFMASIQHRLFDLMKGLGVERWISQCLNVQCVSDRYVAVERAEWLFFEMLGQRRVDGGPWRCGQRKITLGLPR